jgi:hypothetical protein
MYSPWAETLTAPTAEGWLKVIRRKYGPDYLTVEEEKVLLESGVDALLDILPEGK